MATDGDRVEDVVRAAGGVVLRSAAGGSEVCVIHRPEHGDWSFPKGKLHGGESFEHGALREVREETGYDCEVGPHLADVRYRDAQRRPKLVRYFLMRPIGGGGRFRPTAEVDALRWLPVDRAADVLTYRHDRELLAGVVAGGLAD